MCVRSEPHLYLCNGRSSSKGATLIATGGGQSPEGGRCGWARRPGASASGWCACVGGGGADLGGDPAVEGCGGHLSCLGRCAGARRAGASHQAGEC